MKLPSNNLEALYGATSSFWQTGITCLEGNRDKPADGGGIVIIGSGFTGVSVAYWLQKGMHASGLNERITLVDFEPASAATYRNSGHIIYGAVESMKALCAIHGPDIAREVWGFSVNLCHQTRDTINELALDVDYAQNGYLVVAIDENENQEIQESVELLNQMGFESTYLAPAKVRSLGFKGVYGGRFERGSAQAHPGKFRNELLAHCLRKGLSYHSGVEVANVEACGEKVVLETNWGPLEFDACVIAANAYSPLLSRFFHSSRLIEPFRGQIITSKPLSKPLAVKYPHSFDHGYVYALGTPDNRLMIGGWRNHTAHGEVGTYDLTPNPQVETGLKAFAAKHYCLPEDISWEFSWSGIMGASKTGFPFIGPTTHPRILTCAGYTGHGFSWAHGCAKILADIVLGEPIPAISRLFNPMKI